MTSKEAEPGCEPVLVTSTMCCLSLMQTPALDLETEDTAGPLGGEV